MSQPVKLSDGLVLEARIAGEAQERSIAGQVEFWANLGRAIEAVLDGRRVLALCRNAGSAPLSEALASVDTAEGRKRVENVLANRPYPHYRQYSPQPGLLVRIEENGTETVGRFVNREFTAVATARGRRLGHASKLPIKEKQARVETPSQGGRKAMSTPKESKTWA